MRIIEIKIPQNVVDEIQRSSLEVNARQGVIDRYFEKHMNDEDSSALDSKPFMHFMSLLAEAETEFELAKNEITKNYIPEYLQNHNIEWNLDYSTSILTVIINCDCEIPELEEE